MSMRVFWNCLCFEPQILIHHMCINYSPLTDDDRHYTLHPLYPYDLICQMQYMRTVTVIIHSIYENTVAALQFRSTSCFNVLLEIYDCAYEISTNRVLNPKRGDRFIISDGMSWKTRKLQQSFTLQLFAKDYYIPKCSIDVIYHPENLTSCTPKWIDVTPSCHKYWTVEDISGGVCRGLRCYFISSDQAIMSWNQASEECKRRNSTLLTINSEEEMDLIRDIMQDSSFDNKYSFLGLQWNMVSNITPSYISEMQYMATYHN